MLALTEEQALFRDTIADFVAKEVAPVARDYEHEGRYPTEIVESMARMGLFGMTVPVSHGGMGVDPVSYAVCFEEIARGWMGIAGILGTHSIACRLIDRFGTAEQRDRFLPGLATGARRSGLGLTEPGAGSDLQGISLRAVRDGDHYVLNGTKTWITNARHADPLPVLVKTDPSAVPAHRGMSILLAEAGTYAVSRDLGKLGYKGPETCEIHFDDARVPVENLLGGSEGRGLQQALSGLELGRLNVSARAVGVAQASLDKALAYAKERRAFGQAIGEFQAVQLKLADMASGVQAARLLTWWAAGELEVADASGGRADRQTGMAKVFSSEVALRSAFDAMSVHGAYGYSTEFEVERLYRDAPLMAIGEGTNDVLRTVIARHLLA